jgi:ACS family tartrate transporter-like MFS transporter
MRTASQRPCEARHPRLGGKRAAAGIAAINSIGNLGGFIGPSAMGWLAQLTGSFAAGLMLDLAMLLLGIVIVVPLTRRRDGIRDTQSVT